MTDLILLRNKVLLLVEDDETILKDTEELLCVFFKKIITANNGEDGYIKYIDYRPDIILTDIKMPKKDGLELIVSIRENNQSIPIIIFSAYNDQKYLFKAINLFVDGYILKPTNLQNMIEVLTKCSKRMQNKNSRIKFLNGTSFNISTGEMDWNSKIIQLPHKENEMMNLLISHYPNIVTKNEISNKIWPSETISDSAIKNIIARLREKIGAKSIIAVHGIGWRLNIVE